MIHSATNISTNTPGSVAAVSAHVTPFSPAAVSHPQCNAPGQLYAGNYGHHLQNTRAPFAINDLLGETNVLFLFCY